MPRINAFKGRMDLHTLPLFRQEIVPSTGHAAKPSPATVAAKPAKLKQMGFGFAPQFAGSAIKEQILEVRNQLDVFLKRQENAGHTHANVSQLTSWLRNYSTVKGWDPTRIRDALTEIRSEDEQFILTDSTVAHKQVRNHAFGIAKFVRQMLMTPAGKAKATDYGVQEWWTVEPTTRQLQGVKNVFSSRLSILMGGPGTGKTTSQNAVAKIAKKQFEWKTLLMAPTGAAAKRMNRATGEEASTIHRALKARPDGEDGFIFPMQTISQDLAVMDEVSMVGDYLFRQVSKSLIPQHSHLLLILDPNQIQPKGAGQPGIDLINFAKGLSGTQWEQNLSLTVLDKPRRYAQESAIYQVAETILGRQPPSFYRKGEEYEFIERTTIDEQHLIREVVEHVLASKKKMDGGAAQVLTHRRNLVFLLNDALQAVLNPGHDDRKLVIEKEGERPQEKRYLVLKPGDRVMHVKNNYDLEVFNGDTGSVLSTRPLVISYDDREVTYSEAFYPQLELAYAMTIDKSQGSEFQHVILALPPDDQMVSRQKIYTGVTRAKQSLKVIGTWGRQTHRSGSGIYRSDPTRRSFLQFYLDQLSNELKQEGGIPVTGSHFV